jgi:hypothetical protein
MANIQHLEILKQGVEFWNKWREENKSIFPDLSGADLRNIDLSSPYIYKPLKGYKEIEKSDPG